MIVPRQIVRSLRIIEASVPQNLQSPSEGYRELRKLCPVAASAAFPHDQQTERPFRQIQVNGRVENYNDQLFWAGLASLAYLPSTVAPIGFTSAGLPVGMQIIGAYMQDKTTIEFARLLAAEMGGFSAPPKFL